MLEYHRCGREMLEYDRCGREMLEIPPKTMSGDYGRFGFQAKEVLQGHIKKIDESN